MDAHNPIYSNNIKYMGFPYGINHVYLQNICFLM